VTSSRSCPASRPRCLVRAFTFRCVVEVVIPRRRKVRA
jgi:hypothetical protein